MKEINKLIDHTILKPEATTEDVRRLCGEAKIHDFASVCVNSTHAALVAEELKGTDVKTCCVVGFPLGACMTAVKTFEAEQATKAGAQEIDMVLNIGAMQEGDHKLVGDDIKAVVEACGDQAIVKVILETCLLSQEDIVKACELSVAAGAHFVKTSTGFSKAGASTENVALMKKTVGSKALVKASGGIRTLASLTEMVEAGADRIGTSNGVQIMNEWNEAEVRS